MKKVLFDGWSVQGYAGITYHGGAEYAKFMLRSAIAAGKTFDIVLNTAYTTDLTVTDLIGNEFSGTVHRVADKRQLYRLIDSEGYDVFYSPLPYIYADYACRAQIIMVIHGLRGVELPWDDYRHRFISNPLKRLAGWAVSRSRIAREMKRRKNLEGMARLFRVPRARYITVSDHSKYSILSHYPYINPSDVEVFWSPFDADITPRLQPADYFLMVSANRYEKNIFRAVKALDSLFSQGQLPGKRVIITGCTPGLFRSDIRNPDRFTLLPYVSIEQLNDLYARAFCFVYPSLNEGFGYPPLMAMSKGVPVIASSATAIPEACGDAPLYFSPTSVSDLRVRLLEIDADAALRLRLTNLGYARVRALQVLQADSLSRHLDSIFS